MDDFEKLLMEHKPAIDRFVYYKLASKHDAEDILQKTYLTAQIKFHTLRDRTAFKAWGIAIARNLCNEYFKEQAKLIDIPLDDITEKQLVYGSQGITEIDAVHETLDKLKDKDKQILYLYFFLNFSYSEIAQRLNIPEGTVKSRLHSAKEHFKEKYPYPPKQKGAMIMKRLPEYLPEYKIELSNKDAFAVRHEELPGMHIIPKRHEKLSFGMYDFPAKKLTDMYELEVTGEVVVHGVHGVEIRSLYISDSERTESTIFAQLTDSFCRYLGGMSVDSNGVRIITTFVDSEFEDSYRIGENNCGFEVNRAPRGQIVMGDNGELTADLSQDVNDLVGRYTLTLGSKVYDTVRLVDIELGNNGIMLCEYYLDQNGRTILWRRFNHDCWALERYKKKWSELLPENERLYVNGEMFVHWYDCLTDYVQSV